VEQAGVERNRLFSRCVRDGLILGVVTGLASGTVAAPVLGTIIGGFVGLVVGVPVALIAGAVIGQSVRDDGSPGDVRRRIDVTFIVLGAATAALAVGWISLDPLVGAGPAVTMFVVVALGLVLVRRGLRRLPAVAPAV
jgi:hypothetical protein